jgi:hypothetical protein
VKVSESVTLRRLSLVKSLGYNLDEGSEVRFRTVVLVFWILEAISCA